MPSPQILVECQDLNAANGSGISSYVGTLAQAIRGLDYSATALFSTSVPLSSQSAIFRDIALSDASFKLNTFGRVKRNLSWLIGSPRGIRPVPVEQTGTVVNPIRTAHFDAFDRSVAATNLFTQARRTFSLYGRFATLKLPEPPALFHASRPIPLRVPDRPNIYTIHDIVPLRLPYASLDRKKFYYRQIQEILRKADKIVTVSEFSRDDLCSFFDFDPRRVTTTYQAVSLPKKSLERSEDDLRSELRSSFGLEYGEYYMSLGTIEPKKNVSRLVDGFAASKTKCPLVIVGALGWLYDQDVKKINDDRFLGFRMLENRLTPDRRVRHLDYLPRTSVISLIRGARALVFPSIYEGFGLPVVEAMTLGTPVITSNVSALPEIAGGAALLVDPYDVDALTSAIDRVDADADLRAELSALGLRRAAFFSQEQYRARIQDLYKELLG